MEFAAFQPFLLEDMPASPSISLSEYPPDQGRPGGGLEDLLCSERYFQAHLQVQDSLLGQAVTEDMPALRSWPISRSC